jgi:hypothetical protein
MVQGLRVVFSPTPAALSRYGYRVPATGTCGTITAARVGAGLRTYLDGPGGGLVFVEWDEDGLVCRVSMCDLTLEPADDQAHA